MTFRRRVEDFTCEHCGNRVEGDGFTNHCPRCLWSKHVDVDPGDRAEECRGSMEPMSAAYERDEIVLVHQCVACGAVRRNRAATGDDPDELAAYLGRPVQG